jgi:hypothetical protein
MAAEYAKGAGMIPRSFFSPFPFVFPEDEWNNAIQIYSISRNGKERPVLYALTER